MRLAVIGVVAFLVGLGAATGVVVLRAPAPKPAVAAPGSSPADSSSESPPAPAAPAPAADPARAAGTATATATTADSSAASPAAAASAADSTVAMAAAARPSLSRVAVDPVGRRAAVYRQVARILTTMKPAEAAGIMSHLTDDQVEGIVRAVGVRQAAALLGQLPTERAAALSRRLIERPSPEEK